MKSLAEVARWVPAGTHARPLWVGHHLHASPTAPRALLLHGNPASMDDWGALWPSLGDDLELLAPDLPGFGRSDDIELADGLSALDTAAECAHGAGQEVGWKTPYYVIGHSHGAGVALALAARYPNAVAGIVLISSLGVPAHAAYQQLALPGVARLLGASGALLEMRAARPLVRAAVRKIMKPMFAPASVPDALVDQHVESFVRRPSVLGHVARLAKEDPSARVARDAQRITAPVLFIHGAEDKLVPIANAAKLRTLLTAASSCEFETVPRAGHLLQWTHSAEVSGVIRAWLARMAPLSARPDGG